MTKKLNELKIYTGIAILFVVIIHANAEYLNYYGVSKYSDMRLMFNIIDISRYNDFIFAMFFNIIDKVIHVAVPMFIFIAGYKFEMNNKSDKYKEYLFRKLKKYINLLYF